MTTSSLLATTTIGEFLKRARERMGLTQQAVADRIGYRGYEQVSRAEHDRRDPGEAAVYRWLDALRLTPVERDHGLRLWAGRRLPLEIRPLVLHTARGLTALEFGLDAEVARLLTGDRRLRRFLEQASARQRARFRDELRRRLRQAVLETASLAARDDGRRRR
jgi:transcriptional regulator with XRE-family HTH domain